MLSEHISSVRTDWQQVTDFMARVQIAQGDTTPLDDFNHEILFAICERTITGLPLLLRQQIPRNTRKQFRVLYINWNAKGGEAHWGNVVQSEPFNMLGAAWAAAEMIGGCEDDLADIIAQQIIDDLQVHRLVLPGLCFTRPVYSGLGHYCIDEYAWER